MPHTRPGLGPIRRRATVPSAASARTRASRRSFMRAERAESTGSLARWASASAAARKSWYSRRAASSAATNAATRAASAGGSTPSA